MTESSNYSKTTSMQWSELLGRRVRKGDWAEQAVSTYEKIQAAIRRRDVDDACELADYTIDEAKIIYDIMRQWQGDLRKLLAKKGVGESEVAAIDARLLALLDWPDGSKHNPERAWGDYQQSVRDLRELCRQGHWERAFKLVGEMREHWRVLHDRDADWSYGLMSALVERFGEEVTPEIYEHIAGPLFNWRYAKFDISHHDWKESSLPTLLYVTFESMRAHLSTRNRDGSPLEFIEHEDRWEVRFDPCGSGGRIVRGDQVEGTPSRMEAPYNFRHIEGAYPWTDGKRGVCIYCNHCQVMMEHMSIDLFGYPARVVEPPTYPDKDAAGEGRKKCSWTMYKDPTQVPEEIYTRCGRKKPEKFGSEHIAGNDNRPGEVGFIGKG